MLDRVREYELAFAGEISGAYMNGFNLAQLQLAQKETDALLTPFVCNCGDIDCWQLWVTQSSYQGIVSWHNWHNPSRTRDEGWDYRSFAALNFYAAQYQAEITKALAVLAAKAKA